MNEIAERLLTWYGENARKLPWRRPPGDRSFPDPYLVWVSEIMLQQTQVETVIPYYQGWIKRFPSVKVLAEASEQDVLTAWEGLGYYSRARNLHHASRQVMDRFGGTIPSDNDALLSLPGVGRYTAGAIASIAFNRDEPALDGNIRRVLARVFNLDEPAQSPRGVRRLWELAAQVLPPGRAGDHNQAIMDLGATICTPQKPVCLLCPLMDLCQARLMGMQEERPVMRTRPTVPYITVTAGILERDGLVLIARRPSKGLLGGMWEFPGGTLEEGEDLPACLKRELAEELGIDVAVGGEFGVYQHAYTHLRVTLHAFRCTVVSGEPQALEADELKWIRPEGLADFPMGKIDRQIAKKYGRTAAV